LQVEIGRDAYNLHQPLTRRSRNIFGQAVHLATPDEFAENILRVVEAKLAGKRFIDN
jgi:hypothetical protein